ncbi:hypothetical protein [uncultured Oceanisphaera sp.]|uniref:hypothetical protein n=1 Tax=uncultured Oceanisphaera sp. TaxID=353858 RepID=UPI00262D87AD|nr:hypothetical protein [uncultured Oceanisphaera sp.]
MNALLHPLEQKLNGIKHQLFPLRRHVITSEQPAVIQAYATLLAAILRGQPSISAEQDMLFRRLLHAMDLDGQQAQLLANGGQLSNKELLDCIELIQQSDKKNALMLDILILLRINNHLSTQDLSLVSELAAALSIHEKKFRIINYWLNEILGINEGTSSFEPQIRKHKAPSKPQVTNSFLSSFTQSSITTTTKTKKLDKEFIVSGEVIIDSTNIELREYAKTSGVVLTNNPEYIYIVSFPHTFSTWIDLIDFDKFTHW